MSDDPDPGAQPDGDLPQDAQRLVEQVRKGVRDDVNSILDERLRVNDPDPAADPADPEPDPPKPQSFLERLGF
jgi:hypothetical protein